MLVRQKKGPLGNVPRFCINSSPRFVRLPEAYKSGTQTLTRRFVKLLNGTYCSFITVQKRQWEFLFMSSSTDDDKIYFQQPAKPQLPHTGRIQPFRVCALPSTPLRDPISITKGQLSQCIHACSPGFDTIVNLEEPRDTLEGSAVRRSLPSSDQPTSGRKAEAWTQKEYHEAVPLIILHFPDFGALRVVSQER